MTKKILVMPLLVAMCYIFCACSQSTAIDSKIKTESVMTWQEYYDLGLKYLAEGNYAEAVIAFTGAIEIDPKQAVAYIGRAEAYIGDGEDAENLNAAMEDYKKALDLDDKNEDAYLGLADVYIRMGDLDKATAVLEGGINKCENNDRIKSRLDEILGSTTDREEGEESKPADEESDTEVFDESGQLIRRNYFSPDGTLNYYSLFSEDEVTGYERIDNFSPDGILTQYFLHHSNEDGTEMYEEGYDASGKLVSRSIRVTDATGQWLYSASLDENGNVKSKSVAVNDDRGSGWDNYDGSGELTAHVRRENGQLNYYDSDWNLTQYSN